MNNDKSENRIQDTFISYAQNFEDVLLNRVFKDKLDGFYIDIGTLHPTFDSVTRAFYDRGWSGINIEPIKDFYDAICRERSRDINLNIAVSDRAGNLDFFQVLQQPANSTLEKEIAYKVAREKGLNVASYPVIVKTLSDICEEHISRKIDFLKIDVEGVEEKVLLGGNWEKFRPTILIIESTLPNTNIRCHTNITAILEEKKYQHVLFDGINDYFIAEESIELSKHFAYPINVLDFYVDYRIVEQQRQINQLMAMVSELQGKDLQVASSRSNRVEPQIPLTEFQIGRYNILIQTDHALPGYQVNYPLYDRFLPFLVANTASSDWAIDVGANVGDTLFAILDRKSDAKVLCIEGDDDFFELMKINIERNKALTQSAEIEASCYLVGTGNLKGSLAGVAGTKGLVLDNDAASETFATKVLGLDEIIKKQNIGIDRIKLLKVDTDGFDFDVITSGKNLLSQQKPLIYFENQISNDSQRQGYEKMYELLCESGYTTFYVFDNFGALMLKTHSIEALDYLNTYMQFQNKQQATRTCYYYDILCAANDDIAICDAAIADYHTWINNRQLSESSQSSTDKNNLCEPLVAIDGIFFQLYNTGIARVWKSLLEEWANTEFGNHLVVLDRVGTAPKIEGISYYQIPAYDYNNTDADRQMLQQVCDELGGVLFISTYYTTPLETPSVFMGYDMIPEVLSANLNQPMWQEKQRGIAHASAFLTISEHTAKDLLKYYPEIDPSTVTPALCGVQPVFKPAQPTDIEKWSTELGITKPYFLLVGAGGGYKNTILFWQGFAQLTNNGDFDIVCTGAAGIGAEEYSTYAPGSQVHCLQLDDRSLNLAYAGAIALIYPSKYEGFGLPIVEALASGCPVITCHNASIPEVAGTSAIYIDDTSIDEMTQALVNIQQPEIRDPLIAQGLIQSQKFSWGKMAGIIQSVLLDRTLAHLQLNSKNLIIFPDWSADEEELGEELSQIFERLAQDSDSEPLTLLIDTSNGVDPEAANMLVSTVAMNIMMSADIDITEQFEIAFTGELAPIQWQALLPKLQGRIKLNLEDVRSILKVRGYANESSGANLISEIQLTESPALTLV